MHPRLAILLPNYGDYLPAGQLHKLLDIGAMVEQAGADTLSVGDHVALGSDLSGYPYGAFPTGPAAPWLEPLTTLSAIAARTSTIRLSTGVVVAPLRPAVLLAKTAATLDVLSGGRLDLGVGTGWLAKEFEAAGVDYAERTHLFDRALAACTVLWQGGPASLSTPGLSFSDVYCYPLPLQEGGVPLWFGGKFSPNNLARVVRYGRGWITPPDMPRQDIGLGVRRLDAALAEAGREPGSVRVRALLHPERDSAGNIDPHRSVAVVPDLVELGVTDVSVLLTAICPDPADVARPLAEVVAAFRSAY